MKKSRLSLALVALLVLGTVAPSQAVGRGGGAGFAGGRGGPGFAGPRGGPAVAGSHHAPAVHAGPVRHHHFHGRGPILVGGGAALFLAPLPWWYYSPAYVAPAYAPPAYWYYCPSYGAYYPTVPTCPEPWLPVPVAY